MLCQTLTDEAALTPNAIHGSGVRPVSMLSQYKDAIRGPKVQFER